MRRDICSHTHCYSTCPEIKQTKNTNAKRHTGRVTTSIMYLRICYKKYACKYVSMYEKIRSTRSVRGWEFEQEGPQVRLRCCQNLELGLQCPP